MPSTKEISGKKQANPKYRAKWTYAYYCSHRRRWIQIAIDSTKPTGGNKGKELASYQSGVPLNLIECFPSELEFKIFQALSDYFPGQVERQYRVTLNEFFEIYWVIDFLVLLKDGSRFFVEAKGFETADYKKQFKIYQKLRIEEPDQFPALLIVKTVKSLRDQLKEHGFISEQLSLIKDF